MSQSIRNAQIAHDSQNHNEQILRTSLDKCVQVNQTLLSKDLSREYKSRKSKGVALTVPTKEGGLHRRGCEMSPRPNRGEGTVAPRNTLPGVAGTGKPA
ncbi:MAG TPA: hypothetical protein V6C97_16925, partial [Oculatellaceae cyanobacterium]